MSHFLTFSPAVGPDVAIRDGRVHVVFGPAPWTWLVLDFEGTLIEKRQQPCGYYPKTNGRVSVAHDGTQFIAWGPASLILNRPGPPVGVHATGISPSGLQFFYGVTPLPNPYASYGLWECFDDGTCLTWDQVFYGERPPGCYGQTYHVPGADLALSEGAYGVSGWLAGHHFGLWPGQETMWPRGATDGTHAAIVCWGNPGPTVKVWIGTLAELAALPAPVVIPPETPKPPDVPKPPETPKPPEAPKPPQQPKPPEEPVMPEPTISDPEFTNAGERIEARYNLHPERYAERLTRCDNLGYARWQTDYYTLRRTGKNHENAIREVERRIARVMGDDDPWPLPF